MSLADQLRERFSVDVRERGIAYYHDRRVQLTAATASAVIASVNGTLPYSVILKRSGSEVLATCSCPYASPDAGDGWACKHMWAVVLAAQAKGALSSAGDFDGPLRLVLFHVAGEARGVGAQAAPRADRPLPSRLPPMPPPRPQEQPAKQKGKTVKKPSRSAWRKQLARLPRRVGDDVLLSVDALPLSRQLLYVLNIEAETDGDFLELQVFFRDRKPDGSWTKAKSQRLERDALDDLPEDSDRKLLGLLAGAADDQGDRRPWEDDPEKLPAFYNLNDAQGRWLLPEICQTGRCYVRADESVEEVRWHLVTWDEGAPWRLQLTLAAARSGGDHELTGVLERDGERLEFASLWQFAPGLVFTTTGRALRYAPASASDWVPWLMRRGPVVVPAAERAEFLAELLRQPGLPPLSVPADLAYEEVAVPPQPRLAVRPGAGSADTLVGELSFDYQGTRVSHHDTSRALLLGSRVLRRDFALERAACARLQRQGWRWTCESHRPGAIPWPELAARHLPKVVRELTAEGWHVEAEGRSYRAPGQIRMQVSSGIDWFELRGEVEFGDTQAALPVLLAALRAGENMVRLDDGSYGLLPEKWLRQYGLLAGVGKPAGDHLRFSRSQAALLDALLAGQPGASCDAVFEHARNELRRFKGIRPAAAPQGFRGELRRYQAEGLGWLHFLRQFSFGGCLADDMGLGKTVQVLALLEARRAERESLRRKGGPVPGPSLIVVPKSLIFNWKQEAGRFAPLLKVLDHTGGMRQKGTEHVAGFDVVLTTYGTLRNDVVEFKDVCFDYVILDEAQAIKNASSASAKAVRLLSAGHRLAMSGTPVENHLGELWSLFEFLNPGMLGAASVFQMARGSERNSDPEDRRVLAQALRPFLLRRTKEQVIKDLPPKVEQTLYCDLESGQRRLYDELREHYRSRLLNQAKTEGIGRVKIQILEALLRLRQAALHPGLLDEKRRAEPSAKLELLLPRLKELAEEGHKTLVFSQFTGLLSILREQLDAEEVPYEYLDGKTRDREACVRRFQDDSSCRLFLISLKAGGVGLNLTAAQYVFLLDPWWNPAVEAQAIDRAHRLGQQAQVFAYRIIARDTVEEKVLELQGTKRQLADAILGEDNSLIGTLGVEDLQLLLS
jgi:hypothetical protein